MEMIKKFRELNENNNSDLFDKEKRELFILIQEFIEKYEDFSKMTSSKNWRSVGTDLSNLRQVKSNIVKLKEITEEEKSIPWIKKELGL